MAYYVCVWLGKWQLETLVFVFGLMAIMTIYVITFPKYKSQDAMLVFTGIFYVAVMLSYIYKVRVAGDGLYLYHHGAMTHLHILQVFFLVNIRWHLSFLRKNQLKEQLAV